VKCQLHSERYLASQIVDFSMATVLQEFEPRNTRQERWSYLRVSEAMDIVVAVLGARKNYPYRKEQACRPNT